MLGLLTVPAAYVAPATGHGKLPQAKPSRLRAQDRPVVQINDGLSSLCTMRPTHLARAADMWARE